MNSLAICSRCSRYVRNEMKWKEKRAINDLWQCVDIGVDVDIIFHVDIPVRFLFFCFLSHYFYFDLCKPKPIQNVLVFFSYSVIIERVRAKWIWLARVGFCLGLSKCFFFNARIFIGSKRARMHLTLMLCKWNYAQGYFITDSK